MYFTCRDLTRNSTPNSWSYFYQSSENNLFLLLKLSSKNPVPNLSQIGQKLLSSLLESPENLNFSALSKLDPNLSVDTLVFAKLGYPNQIKLSVLGKSNVILKRNAQISTIIHHSGSSLKSLSGSIFPQDQILFSDQDFLNQHPWAEVKQKFSTIESQTNSTTAAFLQIQQITINPSSFLSLNIKFLFPVLLVLLLLFLGYFYLNSNTPQAKLVKIQSLINNAQSLKPLNSISSQNIAQKAQVLLSSLEKSGYQNAKLAQYQADINKLLAPSSPPSLSVLPTPSPTVPPTPDNLTLFYDLTNINKLPSYSAFTQTNGNLYLLDPKKQRLDLLSLEDKVAKPYLKGSTLENLTLITSGQSSVYLASNTSLYLADNQGLSAKAKFSSPSLTVSPSQLAFWNNTLYVLDIQSRQIFKYPANSRGFDQPQPWLKPQEKLSVSTQSFAIDSFVWTLSSVGSVNQYLKGEKQNFKLQSNPDSLQSSNLIVPVSQDKLAFLTDGRIIVLYDKQGQFIQKYTSPENVLGILYYNNSLLLLTEDQKIYQIKL